MKTISRAVPLLLIALLAAGCGSSATTKDVGASKASSDTTASGGGTSTDQARTPQQWSSEPKMTIDTSKTYLATMKTDQGTITIRLLAKEAPHTVNNFVFLAGKHFYDGVPIHRIVPNFMFQTGDPTGTGGGGPGYSIADEPVKRTYTKGIVAMANAGPNTGGSQFFVMLADYQLPPNYTIFGQVTQGLDVVDKIGQTPVVPSNQGEVSKPKVPRTVQSVTIATQ